MQMDYPRNMTGLYVGAVSFVVVCYFPAKAWSGGHSE